MHLKILICNQSLSRNLAIRCFTLALICFAFAIKTHGQTSTRKYYRVDVEITKEKRPKKIHTKVEIIPGFPGADSSWSQSLEKVLNQCISPKNGARAGTYTVTVSFLIERDGSMNDIICLTDPGFGMCEHVMTAIKKSFPRRWSPQIDTSGKVRRYHTSTPEQQFHQ